MVVQAALAVIAAFEAVELFFVFQGSHFFVESWLVRVGTLVFGTSSSPISPVSGRAHDTGRRLPRFYREGSGCAGRRTDGPAMQSASSAS